LSAVVRELGAVAGWAAIVGLVVLWALYLSQARDVQWLREWAGAAPERARAGVPAARRRSISWDRRTGLRAVATVLVGLLAVGGAAARLTGDGGGDDAGRAQAKGDNNGPSSRRSRPSSTPVVPGEVTVAVLNGTTVPGLAAALRDRLAAAGFSKGMINDFSDPQLAASVVQYGPGHQAAAQAVGRRLGISRREPVTAASRALAGDATVIVIAGADQAP
jgi:LytR cell envelope-related transcriptional attenuator